MVFCGRRTSRGTESIIGSLLDPRETEIESSVPVGETWFRRVRQ